MYHRCSKMATILADTGISEIAHCEAMVEIEYQEYLENMKTQIGGGTFEHKAKHLVLQDCHSGGRRYFGGIEELIGFAEKTMIPPFVRSEDDQTDWIKIARQECEEHLTRKQNPLVYMDIALDPTSRPKRVVFQLFSQDCPKTCENFRMLSSCKDKKSPDGLRLTYKGSPFHRVVHDGWVQGGDIVSGAGDGGVSIYGVEFGDENFSVELNKRGVLAMANDGPHTNSSQFLVTLSPQSWLNRKVVAFGRVIMGFSVIRQIGEMETFNQRPVTECKVCDCGELTPEEYAEMSCI
ncbi:unnamed protein product [Ascophyllum nodosum]